MPSPPANQTFSLYGDDIQASPRPIADDQDDQAEEADLSFTKRKRLHPQDSDSEQTHPHESQGSITRKVEIKKASERYNTWKDMYDSINSRLEAMRAAADPDDNAIIEELDNLSKDLDKYNESVKEKKTHLDELISQGCEGHVEIVVYDPANFRKCDESSTQNSPQSTRALRKRPKLIQKEQRQAALTDTNVRRKLREPKKNQESRHASDSEGTGQPPQTQSSPEPSYASLFTGADIDLTQIIKDVTCPEALYIKSFTKFLPSNQFNWGLALGSSVVNIIFCWTHAMPPPWDLGDDNSIGSNIKCLTQISNHEDMTKFLKTATACPLQGLGAGTHGTHFGGVRPGPFAASPEPLKPGRTSKKCSTEIAFSADSEADSQSAGIEFLAEHLYSLMKHNTWSVKADQMGNA
ncbi:hypothetical protein DFH28DRAFT_1140973 [Melampsora americana]|nr:hypothetical protein DFH28DRAFT_1140973 [Melampsora americana]